MIIYLDKYFNSTNWQSTSNEQQQEKIINRISIFILQSSTNNIPYSCISYFLSDMIRDVFSTNQEIRSDNRQLLRASYSQTEYLRVKKRMFIS